MAQIDLETIKHIRMAKVSVRCLKKLVKRFSLIGKVQNLLLNFLRKNLIYKYR